VPQVPQFCGSFAVLTQVPLQSVMLAPLHSHVPLLQLKPFVVSQALSHWPQCLLLDWRSKQPPLQLS
jgi:hypothetical protein